MKVKVKAADGTVVEGEVQEVTDLSALPEGLLSQEAFESQLERRIKGAKKSALSDALKDEEFKTTALTAWGVSPEMLKGGDLNAEKVQKLRQEWETTTLQPLTQKVEGLTKSNQRLLQTRLEKELVDAAREAGVDPKYLKPVGGKGVPMLVASMADRFIYDPEHDAFFERDPKKEGEYLYSTAPKDGMPFRGMGESLRLFAEDKANADFLTGKPKGPGFQTGGRRGVDVMISRTDATDHSKFTAAEKQAEQQGGQVILTD